VNNGEKRFEEVDEMTSAILRFPDERLASFTSSFGASDVSAYQMVGAEGDLRVDPAYEFAGDLKHRLTIKGKTRERTFSKRDQFAPELLCFSDCVINGQEPEPSGKEGLAVVRIIRAMDDAKREAVRAWLIKGRHDSTPREIKRAWPL
jgi:glucose-fructose oxidoreductase